MSRQGVNPVSFIAGATGTWKIAQIVTVVGPSLPTAAHLEIRNHHDAEVGAWALKGTAGHVRYVDSREHEVLRALSPPLGRPEAIRGALLPIRKSPEWWALAQDERRTIFEEASHHITASMKYLPRIARRLYHARDLGEPFDFLTWFEFAPEHEGAFDELLAKLRESEEWKYVDREIDVRVSR